MEPLRELEQLFTGFPGIGPRQARRFVQYLLHGPDATTRRLIEALQALKTRVRQCKRCYTFFPIHSDSHTTLCDICDSDATDRTLMMVLSTDTDLDTVKKTNTFSGRYFILGGTVPVMSRNDSGTPIRSKELFNEVKRAIKEDGLQEIVCAFACNPDGEQTEMHVRTILQPLARAGNVRIVALGRGLSTGTELEYIDEGTLKNALQNRK